MSYSYSRIRFSKRDDHFFHNLKEDYGCFAIWELAQPYKDRIRDLLSSNFEIVLETEIEWSSRNFHDNVSRLYEDPLYDSVTKEQRVSGYAKNKITNNVFTLFVIKDHKSKYSYAVSTSRIIELSNLNVLNIKKEIRKWIYDDLGVEYAVHATDNIYEFFVQGPLLLGVDLFKSLLDGHRPTIKRICKDLEGADGWTSWSQVFEILNLTSNYLLLENYEGVPFSYQGKDITLLTDNYQRLASSLAVHQSSSNSCKGYLHVEDEYVPITLLFVGDRSFCTPWQKDMLTHKISRNGVFVLPDNMYFFSSLFYCRIRKNEIQANDIELLDSLAKQLHFYWFDRNVMLDDVAVGKILRGYFQAKNYYYEDPIDKKTFANKKVKCYLPNRYSIISKDPRRNVFKKTLRDMIPRKVYLYIHKLIWKLKFNI